MEIVSLLDLLNEASPASKKAAKLGFVHKGFGYYGPADGEATHKSANGGANLYKLKKAYGKKITKPVKKAPKKKVVKKKTKKTTTPRVEKKGKSSVIYHTDDDWTKKLKYKRDKKFVEPIIEGEEIHIFGDDKKANEVMKELQGKSANITQISSKATKMNDKLSKQQHQSWTSDLAKNNFDEYLFLMELQDEWQEYSQWADSTDKERKKRNRKLNDLFSGKYTNKKAITKIPSSGIERGMVLDPGSATAFLKNFRVGKRMVLPPSGWSVSLCAARGFGPDSDEFLEEDDTLIAVIMSLKPKKGSKNLIVGYQCRNAAKLADKINDKLEAQEFKLQDKLNHLENLAEYLADRLVDLENDERENTSTYKKLKEKQSKVEKEMVKVKEDLEKFDLDTYVDAPSTYDDENEIIRPGTVGQKVNRIRKYIFKSVDSWSDEVRPRIVYHIELEDLGSVGKNLWKEATQPSFQQKMRDALYYYLNTTVRRTKKLSPKKLLKKYLNTNVRGGNG